MTTELQVQSNARNAQHSTGPQTAAGQTRAAQNALRHGFYAADIAAPGEEEAEFRALHRQVRQSWQVSGPDEEEQAEEIAVALWRRRRLRRAEGELWAERCAVGASRERTAPHPVFAPVRNLGEALANDCDSGANALEKLRRWWIGNERHLNRCRDRLALMKRLARRPALPQAPVDVRRAELQAHRREIDAALNAPLPGAGEFRVHGAPPAHENGNSAERTQSPFPQTGQRVVPNSAAPESLVSHAGAPVPAPAADPVAQVGSRSERRALARAQRKSARRHARQSAAD